MRERQPTYIETPDMSHMIPMHISVSKLKQMSDAELLAALSGENGRKGMMTMQFIQIITSELQARSIEKAGKPHWSTVPSFWLLVTSVVLSISAIVVAPLVTILDHSPSVFRLIRQPTFIVTFHI